VVDIEIASDGTVWAATEGGMSPTGVSRFDGTAWTTISTQNGLPASNIFDMALVPDNTLWLGTNTELLHIDGSVIVQDRRSGFDHPTVAVAAGPDGILWVARNSYSVARFNGSEWRTEYPATSEVTDVATGADGQVWIGTDGGAARYDGLSWTLYTTADGLVDNHVTDIAIAPDGSAWIGTSNGLSHFIAPP
jgi:ligand-binding sensor domain-containing protein